MTFQEYSQKYENCKNDTLGKVIDYDGEYGGQCWDLVEYYVVNYLGVPAWVLAGCDLVSNLLYPPKINDLLQYFDEIDIHQMENGDICIWDYGHICIYDHYDGQCWFLSQNPGPTQVIPLSQDGSHAFRLKGVTFDNSEPTPVEPTAEEKLKVVKEKLQEIIDYIG